MLDLHTRRPKAMTPHACEVIEPEIAAADRRIDRLVRALYGLTEKEIRIGSRKPGEATAK